MTAPVLIRKSDLSSAAKVAREQGCVIEIQAGNLIYRVIPDNQHDAPQGSRSIDGKEPVL